MNRNRKKEEIRVLSWNDWLVYEETTSFDRLVLKDVPVDVYAVTV